MISLLFMLSNDLEFHGRVDSVSKATQVGKRRLAPIVKRVKVLLTQNALKVCSN